jgi:hypothetical protein
MINKYDTYDWIHKNIDSCINIKQFRTCRKLLRNFHELYNDHNLYRHIDWHITCKESIILNN